MLNQIVVTEHFKKDFVTAYTYTLRHFGAPETEYFYKRIRLTINSLKSMAYLGALILKPAGQNRPTNPRCIAAGNYVIVYKADTRHRKITLLSMFQAVEGWARILNSYYCD